MEDIKQELLKLEFRHKKDIVEAERRSNEGFERMRMRFEEMQLHLNHITKLTGISFEKFTDIESRIEKAANALKPNAKSK